MQILFIHKITKNSDTKVLDAINDLLLMFNHNVVLISYKDIKTVNFNLYSLVLIYNHPLSKKAIDFIEKASIPKILILEESKIVYTFISNSTRYNKIIFLKDNDIKVTNYFPISLIENLSYPFCAKKERIQNEKNERINALVVLKSHYANELIIKITPVLNYFWDIDFKIVSNINNFPEIFNKNTTIVGCENLDEIIGKSDFIIGNSSYVLQAILADKPVIVVGDNGYGGLITPLTISNQYHSLFVGRIGGEIREHIPVKLLIDDIITINKMNEKEKQHLIEQNILFLNEQQTKLSIALNNIITNTVSSYSEIKNNLLNLQLKITNDFNITFLDKESFVITRKSTNFSHSIIDKDCFEIIRQFKEGNDVLTVMNQTNNGANKEGFKRFVIDLINENILEIK